MIFFKLIFFCFTLQVITAPPFLEQAAQMQKRVVGTKCVPSEHVSCLARRDVKDYEKRLEKRSDHFNMKNVKLEKRYVGNKCVPSETIKCLHRRDTDGANLVNQPDDNRLFKGFHVGGAPHGDLPKDGKEV